MRDAFSVTFQSCFCYFKIKNMSDQTTPIDELPPHDFKALTEMLLGTGVDLQNLPPGFASMMAGAVATESLSDEQVIQLRSMMVALANGIDMPANERYQCARVVHLVSAEARNTESLARKMEIAEPELLVSFAAAEHNLAEGIRERRERDNAESLNSELHVRKRAEFYARNAAAMDARYNDALAQLRENALTVQREQAPQQTQQQALQGQQPKVGLGLGLFPQVQEQDDLAQPGLPKQSLPKQGQNPKGNPELSPQKRAQLEQEKKEQHHAGFRP